MKRREDPGLRRVRPCRNRRSARTSKSRARKPRSRQPKCRQSNLAPRKTDRKELRDRALPPLPLLSFPEIHRACCMKNKGNLRLHEKKTNAIPGLRWKWKASRSRPLNCVQIRLRKSSLFLRDNSSKVKTTEAAPKGINPDTVYSVKERWKYERRNKRHALRNTSLLK